MSEGGGGRGALVLALVGAVGGGEVACVDTAGGRLAAGGGRALRVWLWAAGAGWRLEGAAPRAHCYAVTSVRWAPAGALLASGGVDGLVKLWGCTPAGGLEERAAMAAAGATAVRALSWAGARLLAGHDDGAATVWLWGRGELAAVLRAHTGALHALAVAADGALMLTACTEGVLKLHDLEEVGAAGCEGGEVSPLAWEDGAHDLGALCAAACPRGALLATGGQDARVRMWSVTRGGASGRGALCDLGCLDGHEGAVTGVRWGAARDATGARLLASCSLDRTARVWSVAAEGAAAEAACVLLLHAHARYLTCVALDADLRFLVTGSNDKSVRTWSLGTLALNTALRAPCAPLQHFALGDLEGIGPVAEVPASAEEGAAREGWRGRPHGGAVNCLAGSGSLLASASSDGTVRVFRWEDDEECEVQEGGEGEERGRLAELCVLQAHDCGVAAVAWGEPAAEGGPPALLSVALDGHIVLWDVQSGSIVRSMRLGSVVSGGGGARGAALAGPWAAGDGAGAAGGAGLLLLAAGEHNAPLWDLSLDDPSPSHVYECGSTARCCAWSAGARLAAVGGGGGGAAGELRVFAAPPNHALLYYNAHAHDIEIESVAWAPSAECLGVAAGGARHALASAGADELVKLWLVLAEPEVPEAHVRLVRVVRAHGGGAWALRWGGALLASGGGDSWARVWAPREAAPRAALPAPRAGGVLALDFLHHEGSWLVALGGLDGALAVWRLGAAAAAGGGSGSGGPDDDGDGPHARCWGAPGVQRWLQEYVTRPPGCLVSAAREEELLAAALSWATEEGTVGAAGARLLDDSFEDVMAALYCGGDVEPDDEGAEAERALLARLRDELLWLRREPPDHETEARAPHALQCPVTHAAWREPARAADGVTYDRAALVEHWRAQGSAVCALDGARLAHRRVAPNYRARAALRAYLRAQHDAHGPHGCGPRCYFCNSAHDG